MITHCCASLPVHEYDLGTQVSVRHKENITIACGCGKGKLLLLLPWC